MAPITDNEARRERLRPFRILAVALPVTVLTLSGFYAYPSLLARYHFHAAKTAAERNDLAGEQQHLLECLKGWKTDPDIYLRTARVARRLGNFEEADRYLNQCTRFHGDLSEVELERLFLSLDRRNPHLEPRMVLETLRRAPENHAGLPEALEKLSKSCLDEYRLQDALAALTLWIERQPNGVQPFLLRGWVLEQLAPNPQPALPDYRRALELEPDNDVVRLRLAEALVKTKQSAQALPELEALQRRQPASPVVLLNLSLCRADLGDSQEAVQLLDALLGPLRLAQVQELSECLRSDRPLPPVVHESWRRSI
jgi:tetratricopeptide (TPR) repeat protein